MTEDLNQWDISDLNQFFLQKSREYREAIKAGKQPDELEELYWTMKYAYNEMRTRRFCYVPGEKQRA